MPETHVRAAATNRALPGLPQARARPTHRLQRRAQGLLPGMWAYRQRLGQWGRLG